MVNASYAKQEPLQCIWSFDWVHCVGKYIGKYDCLPISHLTQLFGYANYGYVFLHGIGHLGFLFSLVYLQLDSSLQFDLFLLRFLPSLIFYHLSLPGLQGCPISRENVHEDTNLSFSDNASHVKTFYLSKCTQPSFRV